MKSNLICSGIVLLVMVGCAKRPDAIVPVDIPMAAYGNLDCKGIASETIAENGKLAALSKSQNEAATADAVGVFLIGIAIWGFRHLRKIVRNAGFPATARNRPQGL